MADVVTGVTKIDSSLLYNRVIQKLGALNGSGAEATARVTAHVRARTGFCALPAAQAGMADEQVKIRLWAECLTAIVAHEKGESDPWGKLETPKRVDATEGLPPEAPPVKAEEAPTEESEGKSSPLPPVDPPVQVPRSDNPLVQAILDVVLPHVEHITARVDVDQQQVTEIACGIVQTAINNHDDALKKHLELRMAELQAGFKPTVLEVKRWDGTTVELKGQHRQFGTLLKMISSRKLHNGQPVPVYAHGSPGGGKSFMFAGVAEALGVADRFYPYSCTPTDTGSKVIGFMSMATGEYVPGIAYKWFKDGGLLVLSEVDVTDGSVMAALNNLIENDRFTFPNGETVMRHADTYLAADANTIGKGATSGYTRNKLDAATRTRFVFIKIVYDTDLERRLVPGFEGWLEYVLKVRAHVEHSCKETVYITPRASINGAALLRSGVPAADVADAVLFTDFSEATKQTVIANVGQFT